MNLHEYQAKILLNEYGLTVPVGQVAESVTEALAIARQLGGSAWMVKAQIHAGGRGKAGGVRYVTSEEELAQAVNALLGKALITYQTDMRGQKVQKVLIAAPCDIKRELYLSMLLDRASGKIVIMTSTEGGVEIEDVASHTPEKIIKITLDPLLGALPYQARALGFQLNLDTEQIKEFTRFVLGLAQAFIAYDFSLVEINPLIIDQADRLVCLDAKVVIDDNALFRQPKLRAMRDSTQEDDRENRAHAWELNYIALDGNIGCMVNGAGLAMATMDLIKLHGGHPANFLDVGGGATQERVTEAFKIILSDAQVKGVLVNIFGGIVRCDMIADGVIGAVKEAGISVPVVVRLEGNNSDLAAEKLRDSGLNIIASSGLTDAARKIVASVAENA